MSGEDRPLAVSQPQGLPRMPSTEDVIRYRARQTLPKLVARLAEHSALLEAAGGWLDYCAHGTYIGAMSDTNNRCEFCEAHATPLEVAEAMAATELVLEREAMSGAILAQLNGDDVFIWNARELKLLAQLVDSLEQPR